MGVSSKTRMGVIDVILIALLADLLLVFQIAFAFLPNIELVSLLIILYTLHLKRKTLFIIYLFALMEGLIYGFGLWWIMYLYVWTILYFIVRIFSKQTSLPFGRSFRDCLDSASAHFAPFHICLSAASV